MTLCCLVYGMRAPDTNYQDIKVKFWLLFNYYFAQMLDLFWSIFFIPLAFGKVENVG